MPAKRLHTDARQHLSKVGGECAAKLSEWMKIPVQLLSREQIDFRGQRQLFVSEITKLVADDSLWNRTAEFPAVIAASIGTVSLMMGREVKGKVLIYNDSFWLVGSKLSDEEAQSQVLNEATRQRKKIRKCESCGHKAKWEDGKCPACRLPASPSSAPGLLIGLVVVCCLIWCAFHLRQGMVGWLTYDGMLTLGKIGHLLLTIGLVLSMIVGLKHAKWSFFFVGLASVYCFGHVISFLFSWFIGPAKEFAVREGFANGTILPKREWPLDWGGKQEWEQAWMTEKKDYCDRCAADRYRSGYTSVEYLEFITWYYKVAPKSDQRVNRVAVMIGAYRRLDAEGKNWRALTLEEMKKEEQQRQRY